MSCQANILQVLQPGQDGHQKFQHLGLRPVMIVLLLEGQSLELLYQADVFGKPTPSHQKGMLSLLYVCFAVAHDRPFLASKGIFMSIPHPDSVGKVRKIFLFETVFHASASDCTKLTLETKKQGDSQAGTEKPSDLPQYLHLLQEK